MPPPQADSMTRSRKPQNAQTQNYTVLMSCPPATAVSPGCARRALCAVLPPCTPFLSARRPPPQRVGGAGRNQRPGLWLPSVDDVAANGVPPRVCFFSHMPLFSRRRSRLGRAAPPRDPRTHTSKTRPAQTQNKRTPRTCIPNDAHAALLHPLLVIPACPAAFAAHSWHVDPDV